MQIVDVNFLFHRGETKLIRRPMNVAAADAAAPPCPHREAVVIVVTPLDLPALLPGVGSSTVGVRTRIRHPR